MEIRDFAFHQPTTLAEACELGLRLGAEGRYLAGGTEVLPDLKQRREAPSHLIDLRCIPGLREIRRDERRLRIGCLASLSEVAESPAVRAAFPALSETILAMAAFQIRNRGTLGGNFCGAVPSADTPPVCLAGEARVRLAGADGERELAAEEFFAGPRRTVLGPGEILAEVLIPAQPAGSACAVQRFALRRATALAVAAVAARVTLRDGRIVAARVALGAVAPVPMLAPECCALLRAQAPSQALFERAGDAAAREARPISDLRGSADFRRQLIRVLVARALAAAVARATIAGGDAGNTGNAGAAGAAGNGGPST